MLVALVICATSGALVLGAIWGIYGRFSARLEGFLVAFAGGALIVSVMLELLQPASEKAVLWAVLGSFGSGAVAFTLVDLWIDRKVGEDSGGGLLAAIIMDGVPENLALGVVLISVEPVGALALSASIFLSNLPEAAGGAKEMRDAGWKSHKVLMLWLFTAALLSGAAVVGYLALASATQGTLALIQSFAAGAVVASLATEVFPKAYREDHELAGIAVALGVALAFALHQIA